MSTSLEDIARRVNWYTPPDHLLADTDRFLAQVMARGSADDVIAVQRRFSAEAFESAYRHAPPGLFSKRAWAYWGLILLDDPTHPLPERLPGANRFDWRRCR
jgi:hypothetical protein